MGAGQWSRDNKTLWRISHAFRDGRVTTVDPPGSQYFGPHGHFWLSQPTRKTGQDACCFAARITRTNHHPWPLLRCLNHPAERNPVLSTDDIFLLSAELSSDPGFRPCAKRAAPHDLRVAILPSLARNACRSRAVPIAGFGQCSVLEKARLARSGRLLVKLNRTDGRHFPHRRRVGRAAGAGLPVLRRERGFCRLCPQSRPCGMGWLDNGSCNGVRTQRDGPWRAEPSFRHQSAGTRLCDGNRALNGIPGRDCVLALNDIRTEYRKP